MSNMKICPFCSQKLSYRDYGSYYDPPEWYKECKNPKCGKYAISYFYYDGYSFKVNRWKRNCVDEEDFKTFEEFNNRVKYYQKLKRRQLSRKKRK